MTAKQTRPANENYQAVKNKESADTDDQNHPDVLSKDASQRSAPPASGFVGSVTPEEAWELFLNSKAHLVDVRTAEERKYVGRVSNSLHIAWQTGPALIKNPRFMRELENKLGKEDVILLLCRSGKRSAAAAAAAVAAGFTQVYYVQEGFEGDLDDNQQRRASGWRQRGLPWVQD